MTTNPPAYVLDTHAIIWFWQNDPKLGPTARAVMQNPASRLHVPAIALAEVVWIAENKPKLGLPAARVAIRWVLDDPRAVVLPLDVGAVEMTLGLTAIGEMHDRQIVATALQLAAGGAQVALLTNDRNIAASGLVPVLW